MLRVTNKNCFTDVYNFKTGFGDCTCKNYVPNAFTPNGDNINDKFIPHIVCETSQVSEYSLSIYNRRGMKIFHTSSETQAWDGTYKGQSVTNGTYIYFVQYKDGVSRDLKTVKGTLLVLR